jgi:hypothetical protein
MELPHRGGCAIQGQSSAWTAALWVSGWWLTKQYSCLPQGCSTQWQCRCTCLWDSHPQVNCTKVLWNPVSLGF